MSFFTSHIGEDTQAVGASLSKALSLLRGGKPATRRALFMTARLRHPARRRAGAARLRPPLRAETA